MTERSVWVNFKFILDLTFQESKRMTEQKSDHILEGLNIDVLTIESIVQLQQLR